MSGRFVVLILLTILTTSCNKQEEQAKKKTVPEELIVQSQKKNDIYMSGWQVTSGWSISNESNKPVFTNRFSIAPGQSTLEKGIVLVFARKLWEDDPLFEELGAEDKPLQMPFYFLPYFEEPGYTERWDYKVEKEKLDVMLTVEGTNAPKAPKKKVELQFVIIPNDVLSQKQQTETAVRKMSYEEVLQTFNLNS